MESEIILSFTKIMISKKFLGNDLLIVVEGGDRPHIGTAVLAVPRPSLTGDGTISTTASVLNVTGHKDEVICRILAEKASKKYGVTAVCIGGFHIDNMETGQIKEIVSAIQNFDI
ncbi:MAG: hypothetical protein K2O16_15475 [Lachnospiraceae bacterium]|nr:hypothetical protein [Lachnospiraceae bacterium]MDE7333587.1 hypothetical protein [Lachnospiraceae bacterium]